MGGEVSHRVTAESAAPVGVGDDATLTCDTTGFSRSVARLDAVATLAGEMAEAPQRITIPTRLMWRSSIRK